MESLKKIIVHQWIVQNCLDIVILNATTFSALQQKLMCCGRKFLK